MAATATTTRKATPSRTLGGSTMRAAIDALRYEFERRASMRADIWCERYRVLPSGPWSFKYHPWLRDMIASDAAENVGQKSAQMGYTEVALNRSLYTLSQLKRDVLYVLPAKTPDATDFSNARFDPAIELSPKLQAIFTSINNVGLKRCGANTLYVRGSRSDNQLKSIPVALIVLDEVEEMTAKAIALARARILGQRDFQMWSISTPRIPNRGIAALYNRSTQEHFTFQCPHCSRRTELTYPDCLVITADDEHDPNITKSHLRCKECHHELSHEDKHIYLATGQWTPSYPGRSTRGFHISSLYSSMPACHPIETARSFLRAQNSAADEQEFYNSLMGLPHIVDGANVTAEQVDACIRDFVMPYREGLNDLITMGVDVGTKCNVVLKSWKFPASLQGIADINAIAEPSIFYAGTVDRYEDLDEIMRKFKPNFTVIDNLPDTRKSLEFARTYPGAVKLCSYASSNTREITDTQLQGDRITVDRTTWLDLTLGRYQTNKINLPKNIPNEFKAQITNLVRIYSEHPKTGERLPQYIKKGPDHYAHAANYAEIALRVYFRAGQMLAVDGRTY